MEGKTSDHGPIVGISATFYRVSYRQLSEQLALAVGELELPVRIRVVGEEIDYQQDPFDLHVFSLNRRGHDPSLEAGQDHYQLDGEYQGDLEAAGKWIQGLTEILRRAGIHYQIEYGLTDEDGDTIGEEVALSFLE